MESINRNARQRGRVIDYKDLLYGYRRFNPVYGPDYMLDLLLVYRKFKGKRKMTVPVRRHAYLQQPFLEPEFRRSDVIARQSLERVHFILPLAGRYKTFLRFMDNFEESCLSRENDTIALAVVLFDEAGEANEIMARIAVTRSRYPHADIRLEHVPGAFSRGIGLQRGAELFSRDALLVFMDVDMYINYDVIRRIRMNTVRGRRVYYPIVFSQYDPQMTGISGSLNSFDNDVGYWRHSGFGIIAVYGSDFFNTGGFDLEIRGWGREDVELFERFIARNMSVFRAVDIGLVHIFHSIACDPLLEAAQYQMCLGSKSHSYGSVKRLAAYVRSTPEIYRRKEVDGGKMKLQQNMSRRTNPGQIVGNS
jgi:chondroitin sulfate synthase